ncbi:type VI secretion system-associated protein TagO [Shimia abyssi]|uniref:Type VI secretion system VasI family protein n=1 Tax=Shimia abyssi TaxID=1662395 RepID=A0A2P8FDI3_9RHOB|nr:type VI secretion system-associated protein TagO [Shimia abyssi]PSL19780.1 type VI secretion system VasI family protein [Shimia abyssi]
MPFGDGRLKIGCLMKLAVIWALNALAMFLSASCVWAEQSQHTCHSIGNDTKRLSCYDSETKFKPNKPEATPAKPVGVGKQWRLSQEDSLLDGRTDVWLSVTSENSQPNQIGRAEEARLWVRCMNNSTNVFVTFNDYTPDNQNVQYKLDDSAVAKKWMIHMQGGEGIGLWNGKSAIPYVRTFFGKETLVIAYKSYNNINLEFEFDISGLRDRIDPLAESCNWSP